MEVTGAYTSIFALILNFKIQEIFFRISSISFKAQPGTVISRVARRYVLVLLSSPLCCLAAYPPSPLVYPPPLSLTGRFESVEPSKTPTQDTLRTQNQHNTKHMSHRQVLKRGVGEKAKEIHSPCHTNRSHTR